MNINELIKQSEDYSDQLSHNGISIKDIQKQLELFKKEALHTRIQRACKLNDGISSFYDQDKDDLLKSYELASAKNRLTKFVPASGAATRMFRNIQAYISEHKNINIASLRKDAGSNADAQYVYTFITNLKRFAFYDKLKSILTRDGIKDDDIDSVLKRVVGITGLNYENYPKGAILFHKYGSECRTAFEEHLFEAIGFCSGNADSIKVHFTISEEHENLFNKIISRGVKHPELSSYKIEVSYSFQKRSTDTISLSEDDQLLKDENGKLVLRPAGHGALIENLNELNADIVIIKNIDNILPSDKNDKSILFKKLMTGYLCRVQAKMFRYLELLELNNSDRSTVEEIAEFASNELSIIIPDRIKTSSPVHSAEYLFEKLNRPIRVCGMVKNEGEPGGGPFWVPDNNSSYSIQIVEQAQINMNDKDQVKVFNDSTHFNPVEIVCGLKDYKGNNFNLKNYVDSSTGLITTKSYGGRKIKTLELPGLWNGAMAYWNTIFVEIPVETFNPVKTINDLLKPAHQL